MADTKQESHPPLHVVVFPWLAFGHIIPFLELSQQLAKRGHLVTFLSAPRNLARLRPLSPRIRLASLPLPAVDGLPEGCESTADVAPEKIELLKVAFDGLAAPFAAFLAEACAGGGGENREGHGKKPDWVVVDFANHWLPLIADEHKVPCAQFLIFPAAFVAFLGPKSLNDANPRTAAEDFTVPPPWTASTSSPVAYRLHEAELIVRAACQPNASGTSDIERFWATVARCPLLLSRSSREVDGEVCNLLGQLFGKPFVPVGLLAPYDAAERDAAGRDEEDAGLMRWLDAQPERSVLYVAFGSEAPLTPAQVREIAHGLDHAGARFLWALRRTSGGGDPRPPLPDGFKARVAERGVVRVGWVPQVRVLAHAAVGAFMTHAGLSSLVESFLLGGHPLVMLPLIADQGITAQLMAERRVGLEVPRDEHNGSVRGADVAATVRRVMAEEEEGTMVFARNAQVLRDREKQESYVDELVDHLFACCSSVMIPK